MQNIGNHLQEKTGLTHGCTPALTIVPLSEADGEAAARLYTTVFLEDEPTSRRHGLDPARFLPYARVYVRWLAQKDFSFVARDALTGELLGFIFCFDFTDDPSKESPELREFILNFREAVTMIEELEACYFQPDSVMPGSVLHIFQIGVERKGRGRGIARAMVHRALTHAQKRDFVQVVADCTSPGSQRVFEQCGFSRAGFSSYESFSMDGSCFFAGIEGGISLMVADILPTLKP